MMTRIVIVSARVGAGHDGAAYALADRLTGHDVEVLDFLDFLPGALGRRLRDFYHRQLEILPRSWDRTLTALGTGWGAGLATRAATLACGRLEAALGGATSGRLDHGVVRRGQVRGNHPKSNSHLSRTRERSGSC
jgi:hypothetical protein